MVMLMCLISPARGIACCVLQDTDSHEAANILCVCAMHGNKPLELVQGRDTFTLIILTCVT